MNALWAFMKFMLILFVAIPLFVVTLPVSLIFVIAYWLGQDSMRAEMNRMRHHHWF